DSMGLDLPHKTFYLPNGQTSDGWETWTLVQNPNGEAVRVEIDYLLAAGGVRTRTDTVPANSRKSFSMGTDIANGRAGIVVKSLSSGKKVMVERAMYFNNRGAGTDTIGGYSD
ncbi:MAG TPA: hypothetical protein VIK22_07870, partial [Candidatus Anoxymicrobiaceae bacterium]